MNKRQFLSLATFGLGTLVGSPGTLASTPPGTPKISDRSGTPVRSVTNDGVKFSWSHHNTTLIGTLSAPTSGWIAVGFNAEPGLRNTRFIIAATSVSPIRAEEHIARVPDHKSVAELGLVPALQNTSGTFANGRSHLEFQISQQIAGSPALSLAPGSRVHVMLAWSQAIAFDHHSAWRKHFPLTL